MRSVNPTKTTYHIFLPENSSIIFDNMQIKRSYSVPRINPPASTQVLSNRPTRSPSIPTIQRVQPPLSFNYISPPIQSISTQRNSVNSLRTFKQDLVNREIHQVPRNPLTTIATFHSHNPTSQQI